MAKSVTLVINKGVANLVFDLVGEKVNKLTGKVLLEFEGIIDELAKNSKIKALVITSQKPNIFIAGADINEIKDIRDKRDAFSKAKFGQDIFNKLEDLPFPVIAVINGACMGGGLELALACDYRVAVVSDRTKLGLPEVSLGIIPGFGGTQRLPSLVGLSESLKMILSGKPVDAKKAYKIGLADAIFREEFLEDGLDKFLDQVIGDNAAKNPVLAQRRKVRSKRFFEEMVAKYVIFYIVRKGLLKKTGGHYPAPVAALDVIQKTYNIKNKQDGLNIEATEFSKLAIENISKNLIELFFISEEIKKDSGVLQSEVKAKEIKQAGVLGAGIMGGGIAWIFSNYDIPVRMKDLSQAGIALGYKQIVKVYDQLKKIRKYTENQINVKLNHISSSIDYIGFEDKDIVVEAIIEDMDIKKKSLAELEKHVGDDTIIASNTSSLSLTQMSKSLKNPQRFVGMHFFNPVNRMPLVEVIRGEKTSDQTVATIVALSKKIGKTPIVVKDVPGFLVNRILLPYINEAGFLLQDGASIELVDKLITDFGMPMGPFVLADTVGIDVGYKVAKILEEGYGKRMKVCELLLEVSKCKELLGKKSSQGFYRYDKAGKNIGKNPKIASILNKIGISKANLSNEDIVEREIFIMINEASRCIEEGVVKNARHLDMAMIMGTGFPPFRGGILKYADQFGIYNVVKKLNGFAKEYGKRFEPSKLLIEMNKKGKSFYG